MSSFFRKQLGSSADGLGDSSGASPTKGGVCKSGKGLAPLSSKCATNATTKQSEFGIAFEGELVESMQKESFGFVPTYLIPSNLEQNILSGDIKRFVQLPEYVDRLEWISSHAFEFFHLINAFYESISEFCTERKCHQIKSLNNADAGEFCLKWSSELLASLSNGLPLTNLAHAPGHDSQPQSAPVFIDFALTWIDQQLEDPQKFPKRFDGQIDKDFEKTIAKPIFSILYLVLVHIYKAHFDMIVDLTQVGHLNALFLHFVSFSLEFSLVHKVDLKYMEHFWAAEFNGKVQN